MSAKSVWQPIASTALTSSKIDRKGIQQILYTVGCLAPSPEMLFQGTSEPCYVMPEAWLKCSTFFSRIPWLLYSPLESYLQSRSQCLRHLWVPVRHIDQVTVLWLHICSTAISRCQCHRIWSHQGYVCSLPVLLLHFQQLSLSFVCLLINVAWTSYACLQHGETQLALHCLLVRLTLSSTVGSAVTSVYLAWIGARWAMIASASLGLNWPQLIWLTSCWIDSYTARITACNRKTEKTEIESDISDWYRWSAQAWPYISSCKKSHVSIKKCFLMPVVSTTASAAIMSAVTEELSGGQRAAMIGVGERMQRPHLAMACHQLIHSDQIPCFRSLRIVTLQPLESVGLRTLQLLLNCVCII